MRVAKVLAASFSAKSGRGLAVQARAFGVSTLAFVVIEEVSSIEGVALKAAVER